MSNIIFVFGASGAGKTTSLIPSLIKELDNPQLIEIDDIKRELPGELPDSKKNKLKNAQFFTSVKTAIANGGDIIISYPAIMLDPVKLIGIYKSAKSAGYKTQAAFLSVDYKRAAQGIDYRYVQTLKGEDTGEIPRRLKPWRNKIFHYIVPLTLKLLKESKNVDSVRLFNRDAKEFSDSKLKTFFAEQEREYTKDEMSEFMKKSEEIKDFISKNKELFYQKLYQ